MNENRNQPEFDQEPLDGAENRVRDNASTDIGETETSAAHDAPAEPSNPEQPEMTAEKQPEMTAEKQPEMTAEKQPEASVETHTAASAENFAEPPANAQAPGAAPVFQMPPTYASPNNPFPGGIPVPPPQPVTPSQPSTAYRWTYADQRIHDERRRKKQRSGGLMVYALVLTAVFALSFGLLLGVMFMKGNELPTLQFSEPETDEEGQIIVSTSDKADAAAIEIAKHSVVLIEVTGDSSAGSGTGIILSENGYIATNHHVVDGGTNIRVRFYDGTYATATLRGSSEVDDLAVIKVDKSNLIPATFASSADCYVGQTVYAIGNPSGPDMAWTTTRGCISYVNRELKIYKEDGTLEKKLKMIQTDAMVNPGNSGGPLVNAKGEVVGIISMKLANGYEGIGFAIPSDGAAEILEAIIQDGHADNVNSNVSYDRPMIGITGVFVEKDRYYVFYEERIVEVTEEYAAQNPDEVIAPKVSGIYVRALTEGMDAATKLREGDVITAVNAVEATSMTVLMNEINEHYAGDDVTVTYYRNGLYTDVTITLSGANS